MNLLLRSAKIIDPNSSHNGKTADILIKNGRIESIRAKISSTGKVKEITEENLHVSPGWVELVCFWATPVLNIKKI